MGSVIRKEEWYLTYPEFCRIFIDKEQRRDDHVFMRTLDFFGATGHGPLVTTDAVDAITNPLDSLLEFIRSRKSAQRASGFDVRRENSQ